MSARLLIPAALLLCGLTTHPAAAESRPKLVPVTYQVADLVLPANDAGQNKTMEETLIKLVTNTIQPRSWSDMGGTGTIDYFPMTKSLVVNQTSDVQDQIADLLAALRRQQDQQVAVEVRFITTQRREPKLDSAVTILDDRQLGKLFKTIQGDASTNVMQAPKLMIGNGRTAVLDLTEKKSYLTDVIPLGNRGGQAAYRPKMEKVTTGLRLSVRPAVSVDRRSVQVALEVHHSEVDAPVPRFPIVMPIKPEVGAEPVVFTQYVQQPTLTTHALQQTLTIPDGGTALVGGWTQRREERHEAGLPILSDLPYLGRLFKTVGYSNGVDQVLILVTPRIVVAEEKEERKASVCPCPVTQPAGAESRPKLMSCTYQVADLVIPVKDARQARTTEEALIKRITDTIQPRSWCANGGPGTIDYYPMTKSLVVNQASDVQDQIADLLAALRRRQDVQVRMQMRLVSLPVASYKQLVKSGKLNPMLPDLDDAALTKLLAAIQADPAASILCAPTWLIQNGRRAGMVIADNQASLIDGTREDDAKTEKVTNELRLFAQPTVSADRRTIEVEFGVRKSELAAKPGKPQPGRNINMMGSILVIPDGRTLVQKAWTEQRDFDPPILSKIPFGSPFHPVRYTPPVDQVLVLVTPRIMVVQEKEERKAPICPCPRAKSATCATPAMNQPVVRCGLKEKTDTGPSAARLVAMYYAACRDGNLPMAKAIAEQALWLDPACFSKGCGCAKQP